MNLDRARAVADAVLYEGYLLYPYRASSAKNASRWQFGVLSPPGAAAAGLGEEASMAAQCVLTPRPVALDSAETSGGSPTITVHLRFLQLQRRQLYDAAGDPIDDLEVAGQQWLSWDEAVEHEQTVSWPLADLAEPTDVTLSVAGGEDTESLPAQTGGTHLVRHRWPLAVRLTAVTRLVGDLLRLEIGVHNVSASPPRNRTEATRRALIGAHLILEAHGAAFVSMLDPPEAAVAAVASCRQDRCWPVLAGEPGSTDLVLASPIIVGEYPAIAPESGGALFDATEIDEILTLRVMTMTETEKAEARATDPRAREIIDRCDAMSPAELQDLHGALRDPSGPLTVQPGLAQPDEPWWDPAADSTVRPDTDAVPIAGVPVSRGSIVRVHPNRRADAQDLFFTGQLARVTAVLSDVDGQVHVAVVFLDDPAADLHEEYGRYCYFFPDELQPVTADVAVSAGSTIPYHPQEDHS